MTEAAEGATLKTVVPTETATEEKGEDKTSGAGHQGDVAEEAVQYPSENGLKQQEQKSDVTMKEETNTIIENSSDDAKEPSPSTGEETSEDSSTAEKKPVEQPAETQSAAADVHVSEPANNEEFSFSGKKSEDDETPAQISEPAPSGSEEQKQTNLTNSVEKDEGDGLPAEELAVSTEGAEEMKPDVVAEEKVPDNESPSLPHVEQESIPEEIDSSKLNGPEAELPEKVIPTGSVDGETTTSVEASPVEAVDKPEIDSAEKSNSGTLDIVISDEVSTTPKSVSSEVTVGDSDNVISSPEIPEKDQSVVSSNEFTPGTSETGEGIREVELVTEQTAEEKNTVGSEAEADDVHIANTGAQEDKEVPVESSEPLAAAHEEIIPEDNSADAHTADKDSLIEDESKVIPATDSLVPEVKNETDSDPKPELSESAAEPKETNPEEKSERNTDKEEIRRVAEPVEVHEKSLPEADNQGPEGPEVETVKDSESSAPEDNPKHSTGLLEAVGETVLSLGSSALGSAKGLIGLGTSGTDTGTGGEAQSDNIGPQSVDDEDTLKRGDEQQEDATDSKLVSQTETAEVKPEIQPEETDEVEKYGEPTITVAEAEVPAVAGVLSTVTVSDEAQDQLSTSVPKDTEDKEHEMENDKVVPALLDVQPTRSEKVEVSSSEPVDQPFVRFADESPAVLSEPQKYSLLQSSRSVSEASTPEQSGKEGGVKERPLNVVVPESEVGKKPAEESVSTPSTPLTPLTPGGTPLIKRVEQLEKKLAQFEDKQNSPKSQKSSTGPSTPRSSIDRPSRLARHTLEETLSKGSLLERVAALETKLGHVLSVSSSPELSPGTAVKEALEAGVPTPESNNEVQSRESAEPVDAKTSTKSEAMENLVQLDSKENLNAAQKLTHLNTAEDSKPPVAVADVTNVKGSEETAKQNQDAKVSEDSKTANTTAEVRSQEPEQTPELPAAATKKAKAKSGKSGGPVTKLKARFIGCFARGGMKETAV